MNVGKVFISYSHDTPEHSRRVLQLADTLRGHGLDAELDQYHVRPSLGWPRWCEEQLRPENAAFVLVVCSETYRRRVEGKTAADEGRGVFWEGGIIAGYLYHQKGNKRFIPVLLPDAREEDIPVPLRDDTRYHLNAFALDDPGYRALYRELTGQRAVSKPPVGGLVVLSPEPDLGMRAEVKLLEPLTRCEVLSRFIPTDISRIDKYGPPRLIGREEELALLDEAWDKVRNGEPVRPRILSFVALGGEGKTSLAANWAIELAHRDWPGCEAAFAWSFYSQGTREQVAASSDIFLKEALVFFGDEEMAASAAGSFDKGKRLARLVGERRVLLILDGLEPLQYPPTSPLAGQLTDQGLTALLKGLAVSGRGLCVLTTRYVVGDLQGYSGNSAPELHLKRLSTEAGVELLKSLGVKNGSPQEFAQLVEDVDGHALTLRIMGGFLGKAFQGDIRCRDRVKFAKADARVQGGHAFRAMAAYEKWLLDESEEARRELAVLRLMGLFDQPASADCVAALRKSPAIAALTEPLVDLAEEDWNFSLHGLESAKLLTVNRDTAGRLLSLDAHPLLREYFAKQLAESNPEGFRAAHRRLFKHLCNSTREGDQPSLEGLLPLYQAVTHGCRAGLQKKALNQIYIARILRGTGKNGFYSWRKLGAFGSNLSAVACFFKTPWQRISPALSKADQAWLLNEAAFNLRGLGRLAEALEPMQAGLEKAIQEKDWGEAAIRAGNLSELELTLGDVGKAVKYAADSVTFADKNGDAFSRMSMLTAHADALHQAGHRTEAETLFRKAEYLQCKRQPYYPRLYSLQGFRYCVLLLTNAEREAAKVNNCKKRKVLLAECSSVDKRATQTLKWTQSLSPLSIALNHLTLGRAALYRAILQHKDFQHPCPKLTFLDQAVDGLRRAGMQDHLPRGLLTRAWLRNLTGPSTGPESSQSDLDEAREIAERGPMPLHMADIHLYRARLFHKHSPYPWDSPQTDLAEARRLITKHGYLRRKEELEDLEQTILPGVSHAE